MTGPTTASGPAVPVLLDRPSALEGGPLHGLVNLAGYARARDAVAGTGPAAWDDVMAVNPSGG